MLSNGIVNILLRRGNGINIQKLLEFDAFSETQVIFGLGQSLHYNKGWTKEP